MTAVPASVAAVTVRGYVQKSDAGGRSGAMQMVVGSTTVASTSTVLTPSWTWLWRTDLRNPDTSAPWIASDVDNLQFGPKVTA